MDNKFDKNDLNEAEYSSADNDFKSLYGLTPIVENTIKLSLKKKNRQGLKRLIEPLHPADQADMIERLSNENLNSFLNLLGKTLDPEVLVYLDHNVQEKVIDFIWIRGLAKAIPELHSDDAVEIQV